MRALRLAFATALAAFGFTAGPVMAQDDGCPQPAELGQILLPPMPCFDLEVSYDGPTNRYAHGVLGDAIEFSEIKVRRGRTTVTQGIPVTRVWEDLAPRLADVDGQPGPEIITIESDENNGSLIAIYKAQFGDRARVRWIASTTPIGQRFRWLAIIGIADFNGDGRNDIAYVEKPHLDKILRIITLEGTRLVELAAGSGFSNHRIGDDFITGGVADCGRGPEMITPSADWTRVLAARLEDGVLKARLIGDLVDLDSVKAALACES